MPACKTTPSLPTDRRVLSSVEWRSGAFVRLDPPVHLDNGFCRGQLRAGHCGTPKSNSPSSASRAYVWMERTVAVSHGGDSQPPFDQSADTPTNNIPISAHRYAVTDSAATTAQIQNCGHPEGRLCMRTTKGKRRRRK